MDDLLPNEAPQDFNAAVFSHTAEQEAKEAEKADEQMVKRGTPLVQDAVKQLHAAIEELHTDYLNADFEAMPDAEVAREVLSNRKAIRKLTDVVTNMEALIEQYA